MSMIKIRLFLAWLLLAALPLQGFAATSMLFCGIERTAILQTASDGHMGQERRDATLAMTMDQAAGNQALGHAMAGPDAGKTAQGDKGMQWHGCSVCAFSCQSAAMVGLDSVPQASSPPSVEPSLIVARIVTRAITVPDKPPRA